jgi:hypothetical protein
MRSLDRSLQQVQWGDVLHSPALTRELRDVDMCGLFQALYAYRLGQ